MNSPVKQIAVFTAKGGTAKTTTGHSLACCLAERGDRVLVIDVDHQANMTYWFGIEDAPTLFEVARGDVTIAETIRPTAVPGVDLISSSAYLSGTGPTLRTRPGAELWIRRQVATLPHRWDWIVYDCGPGFGLLNIATLASVDRVLAPVEPHVLGLAGVQRMFESVQEISDTLNSPLEILGVVPVKVDRRMVLVREALGQLGDVLGDRLMTTAIRTNIKLAEAPSHHQSIFEYAPSSTGAADYRDLTTEVIQRWPDA